MLPSADLTLWLLTTFVEAFVVYLFLVQGLFRKFLLLNFYLMLSATISIGQYFVLRHFGFRSSEYAYFYFYTDALLTICLFLSICELSARLVGTKMPRRIVVLWSAGALLATVCFSFSVASSAASRVATHFVFELSQNIYFACCLAIVLLWVWKLRNDPEDRIAVRLVSILSVYFSLFLLVYGARELAPRPPDLDSLYPMISAWLPLGCGFAVVSHEQPPRTKR